MLREPLADIGDCLCRARREYTTCGYTYASLMLLTLGGRVGWSRDVVRCAT